MREEYQLYINGGWMPQTDGCVREDIEPATGKTLFTVHRAGPQDVEKALQSAADAAEKWKNVLPADREAILLRAADVMASREEEFLELMVREGGKPQHIARGEFKGTLGVFRVAAGECRRHTTDFFPPTKPGQMSMTVRSPLGVILGILPFNYPIILSVKKLAYAIAAGNSFILKPSPHTPAMSLLLGEVLTQAGLPDGVLNVVPVADEALSAAMAEDRRVRMVSFTGGTRAGRDIARECAGAFKRFAMELGGKNPLILLKDFNVDQAVEIAAAGAFSNQGQLCMATSRIIVEAPLYDEFCEKMGKKAASLKMGDPVDPTVMVGPIIDEKHCLFVQAQVDDAVARGARLLTGGAYSGNFYAPTVLADVREDMEIFYEESFAPVTSIVRAEDPAHALRLCNDNHYGLSASLLTHDLDLAMELSQAMEAGMIHVNDLTYLSATVHPSGGWKDSGVGQEGGRYSMDDYTELKWITLQSTRA